MVVIGTGKDEKLVELEKLKTGIGRDRKRAEEVSTSIDVRSVSAAGSVAWVAANAKWQAKVKKRDRGFTVR